MSRRGQSSDEYPTTLAPTMLVSKKGTTRQHMVCAYQRLNPRLYVHAGTVNDMGHCVATLSQFEHRATLDATSGFWQMGLTKRASLLSSFILPSGRILRWLRMPYGFANAPAAFQELINKVVHLAKRRSPLRELLRDGRACLECYVDDFMAGGKNQEDLPGVLRCSFFAFAEFDLRFRLSKCTFGGRPTSSWATASAMDGGPHSRRRPT